MAFSSKTDELDDTPPNQAKDFVERHLGFRPSLRVRRGRVRESLENVNKSDGRYFTCDDDGLAQQWR
jgi:hypothetical protein